MFYTCHVSTLNTRVFLGEEHKESAAKIERNEEQNKDYKVQMRMIPAKRGKD